MRRPFVFVVGRSSWSYPDPSAIWDEMRQLTPDFAGISYARLEREGGVHWPCPAPEHPGTPFLFADDFPSGRGKFWTVGTGTESEQPDAEYPFVLSTGRVLYHWHGGTMTRVSALDEAWPECTVELHPKDAAQLGLATGDWVDVSSRRGSITARVLVTGRSPVADGLHPVPLRRGCGQRPDRQPARPARQDPGLQGLRGARRTGRSHRPGADALTSAERSRIRVRR